MTTRSFASAFYGVAALTLGIASNPASAMNDPVTGRWLTRDPDIYNNSSQQVNHPLGSITQDTPSNLYEFLASRPVNTLDPHGTLIVALEGNTAYGREHSGFRELLFMGLTILHQSPDTEFNLITGTSLFIGNSEQKELLRQIITDHCATVGSTCTGRKKKLVVFGFSDGATTIYEVLKAHDFSCKVDFVGIVDMVRTSTFALPNSREKQYLDLDRKDYRLGVNINQNHSGLSTDGWKGYFFNKIDWQSTQIRGDDGSRVAHINSYFQNNGIIRQSVVQSDITSKALRVYWLP